ncbi:MAG: DUF2232 domain-containing protein, partial [Firmicutes bacterium]|nr:DUF2232 domain-containing protein [Bacillota bacterium]
FWGLPAGESISWRSLSLPWYALWLPILGLGMSLAGDQWHWASVAAAGKYVLYLSAWPFLAVGCAVAAHYLGSFGDRRYLRLLLLAAALVSWPLAVVACIVVGVLDPVCNWRRVGEGRGDKDRWK